MELFQSPQKSYYIINTQVPLLFYCFNQSVKVFVWLWISSMEIFVILGRIRFYKSPSSSCLNKEQRTKNYWSNMANQSYLVLSKMALCLMIFFCFFFLPSADLRLIEISGCLSRYPNPSCQNSLEKKSKRHLRRLKLGFDFLKI